MKQEVALIWSGSLAIQQDSPNEWGKVSKPGDNGDSDSWFVVTLRHFFLEFRELQCTDGGRGGDGANLITTSSKQITREREERVTVEVKRDKIDRRVDVTIPLHTSQQNVHQVPKAGITIAIVPWCQLPISRVITGIHTNIEFEFIF